ncbi:unnamed protein product [Tetraodon nigroviridis]|uniref:(spotted green pufferfish) hypothetical protein n=1 Tax=Tetraodon nigroviridis TaxID=99883 RepID=Q4T0B0_TETNG|nr:unnamed protein product [Tetraodon nigroviridis]
MDWHPHCGTGCLTDFTAVGANKDNAVVEVEDASESNNLWRRERQGQQHGAADGSEG